MIPYEELSAALERWRVKNGLPGTPPLFAEGSTMRRPAAAAPAPSYSAPVSSYSAPVSSYSAPAPAPSSYGSAPLYAPPAAASTPGSGRVAAPAPIETLDESVDEFGEDDVLAEDPIDNEGPDYAMSFRGTPATPERPTAATLVDEDEHESTVIGSQNPRVSPEDEDEFNAAEKTPPP